MRWLQLRRDRVGASELAVAVVPKKGHSPSGTNFPKKTVNLSGSGVNVIEGDHENVNNDAKSNLE
jgi:hypothetical protein